MKNGEYMCSNFGCNKYFNPEKNTATSCKYLNIYQMHLRYLVAIQGLQASMM